MLIAFVYFMQIWPPTTILRKPKLSYSTLEKTFEPFANTALAAAVDVKLVSFFGKQKNVNPVIQLSLP